MPSINLKVDCDSTKAGISSGDPPAQLQLENRQRERPAINNRGLRFRGELKIILLR